jgi:hypothetical protein
MARTRNTPKSDVVSESTERITGFDSHGARYLRLALPRDAFAKYESDMNRWNVVVKADGSFTATPVRDLVEVTPKTAKGAKAS